MDRAGDELLARAALPLDENRRARRPGQPHELEHLAHSRGFSDDAAEAVALRELFAQPAILLGQAARLGALSERQQDFFVLERLGDVVEGAFAHGLDRAL